MTTQPPPAQTQPRLIRVFVSSTFRDMQAERDELVKFIFPQLRKLCEQRGVTWGEVDLRWGITDEQKSEGRVLPICLDEIQRCRPYFIGLLAERYGWIPDEIPPELIEGEPWLAEHIDHSVTELEILHGVLNNPEMAKRAFFFFRDPRYVDTLLPEQRSAYLESVSSDETKEYGSEEAIRRAEQRRQKLADLKERIRSSGLPVHENYQTPKEFGQSVLRDLTAIIDDLYPEGSQLDPLDRGAAEHEAFALSRAQVYIGRQTYFDQLDAHVRSDGEPLVILGESGSGKSALLANWAVRYRRAHQEDLVLMHFIGATPGSADWMAMLRRILGEFKRKFNIQAEIPDQSDALRSAFANWLNMAAAQGRVVLILDALNQLDDRDGAPDLVWLPPHIPENVCMFLSTLPGRPLDELRKRGWPTLTVEPLQYEERKQLIKDYLELFTKALGSAHTERISSAVQCQNPLFLRVLLDELRLLGMHERLGDQIEQYLEANTIPALYEQILGRCEQDYERERPGLVREAMSLLWAARRGVSEAELMELLGRDGQPLPHAFWSPLHLAMEQSLLNRGGLIGFFHDYLRQAVQDRYLPEQPVQAQAHRRLADYFQPQTVVSPRRVDELPWQLAQAREWKRLNDLLGDLGFFGVVWDSDPFEMKAYWAQVEADSPYRMLKAYSSVVDHPDRYPEHVWSLGTLLGDAGHIDEALTLRTYLVKHYRQTGNRAELGRSLLNQGMLLYDRGDLDGAMTLFNEQERISRDVGDDAGVARSLGNQAGILYDRGDLDGALALHEEGERICRDLGDKAELGYALGNKATILKASGDLDGAMALHEEVERIFRELGNTAGLGDSLNNQANILSLRGDTDAALALYKEDGRICRELGDKAGLGRSLNNQANILYERGDADSALALFKEVERILREVGDKAGLQTCIGNQGMILRAHSDLDGAMRLHKEQERICRELGNKDGLQLSLGNQANILKARGDLKGALSLYTDRERICRELGNTEDLAIALINHALTLAEMKKTREAHRLADESLRLAQGIGYGSLAEQILAMKAKWGI